MHSIKLSEAFQLVDNGPPSLENEKKNRHTSKQGRKDQDDDVKDGNTHKENRKPGPGSFQLAFTVFTKERDTDIFKILHCLS